MRNYDLMKVGDYMITNEMRIKATKILMQSQQLTSDELADLHEELALAEPADIKAEQWIYTKCPNCGEEISKHHGDGYYSCERVDFCPNCRQVFNWLNYDLGEKVGE